MRALSPVAKFLLRRAAFMAVALFSFSLIIFLLPRLIPGNPLAALLAEIAQRGQANPEAVKIYERMLTDYFKFDRPLYQQYFDFMGRLFRGDLGTSVRFFPSKVSELIAASLPWTLALLIPATLVSWVVGNYLGVVIAFKRGRRTDKIVYPVLLILSQTPYYWLAMILLYYFAVQLHLFPVGGVHSPLRIPTLSVDFILNLLHHYTLPFLSIVLSATGWWAIGMRALAIYETGSDYLLYAESLGVSSRRLQSFVLRNCMLPQVTGLAINFGTVLGGALITELVFNYRGTGYMIYQSLTSLDYMLIQGVFMVLMVTLLLAIFIVDIIYAYIDPRIRTGYVGG